MHDAQHQRRAARGRTVWLLPALLAALLATIAPASATTPVDPDVPRPDTLPESYQLPDVEAQFDALAGRPDALGFSIGSSPDPELCKHYQGLARMHGPGTPYLFVTRSGNYPGAPTPCWSYDDDPGNLLVVRMGSRETTGERLRSNRLVRDVKTEDSTPSALDTTTAHFAFDGTDGWPAYGHPGGVQLVGDVLAVALEAPRSPDVPDDAVLFLDVSDPTSPQRLSLFPLDAPTDDFSAGLVAIAPQSNGRYLMLVTGKKNHNVLVYVSKPTGQDPSLRTDLTDPDLDWHLLDVWNVTTDGDSLGQSWPTGGGAHQMLNFVREGGPDGPLYLIGARNTMGGKPLGEDWIDLYRVAWEGSEFRPRRVRSRHVSTWHSSEADWVAGDDTAHLAAASGVYVSPSGELILYATEHENDGPGATVAMGEYRHRSIVRPGSPTYDPSLDIDAPATVAEGGSVALAGTGRQPATKAWLQLWADPGHDDRWIVIDRDDWQLDDFDDFKDLDPPAWWDVLHSGFSDQASSWRWFAPVGCTIRANDDDIEDDWDTDDVGTYTRTLPGTGQVEVALDLQDVGNDGGDGDIDDELTSAQFLASCDDYYEAPIGVAWDLDGDGGFEVQGSPATLSAAGLDGPSEVTVDGRARHPVDGRTGVSSTTITVTNVPPSIDDMAASDPAGRALGAEAAHALVGLDVTLEAAFSDPGILDTQTAVVDWGDGSVEPHTVFAAFTGATGGGTGRVLARHAYDQPGSYEVTLRVTDDDGGSGEATLVVDVVDAAGAIASVVERIDELLADAPDGDAVAALLTARADLVGNADGGAANGALDRLDAGDLEAALVHLAAGVDALATVEAVTGLDLRDLMADLALAARAVAGQAHLAAVAAVEPPSRGELRQLQRIAASLAAADEAIAASAPATAVDHAQDAVRVAVMLMGS